MTGEELRLFVARAPVAIAIFDREMRYIGASGPWLGALGLDRDVFGKTAGEVHADAASRWREIHGRALAGESLTRADERFDLPGGAARRARLQSWPWLDENGAIGGVAVVAEGLCEVSPDAVPAKRPATSREPALGDAAFLDRVAHDFRNPLATISLTIERVASDLEANEGDAGKDLAALKRAIRQGRHLARLLEDVVRVSRMAPGKIALRREPLRLDSLVREAVASVQESVASKDVRLTAEPAAAPLSVEGDPAHLREVLGILLDNAVKFTAAGGDIAIATRREGEQAIITVRDSGAGMAPDRLAAIFDIGASKDPTHKREGLGIHLAFARHLVTLHGGDIEAASAGPGQGSEFTIRLPLSLA